MTNIILWGTLGIYYIFIDEEKEEEEEETIIIKDIGRRFFRNI